MTQTTFRVLHDYPADDGNPRFSLAISPDGKILLRDSMKSGLPVIVCADIESAVDHIEEQQKVVSRQLIYQQLHKLLFN